MGFKVRENGSFVDVGGGPAVEGGQGLTSAEELLVVLAERGADVVPGEVVGFPAPFDMNITGLRIDVDPAYPVLGTALVVDLRVDGTTALGDPVTVDVGDTSSATAGAQATITSPSVTKGQWVSVVITQAPDAGSGLNPALVIEGTRAAPAGFAVRQTASVTISSLDNGATGTGSIDLSRSCYIVSIETNRAGWVRLYDSILGRSADAARSRDVDPEPDASVIAEVIHAGAVATTPGQHPLAMNMEDPTTTAFPIAAVNDGASGDFVITITYLPIEF